MQVDISHCECEKYSFPFCNSRYSLAGTEILNVIFTTSIVICVMKEANRDPVGRKGIALLLENRPVLLSKVLHKQ